MLIDIQQEPPAARCERCDGEIYRGERKYKIPQKGWVCEDCFKSYVMRELDDFPDTIAWELGCDVEELK